MRTTRVTNDPSDRIVVNALIAAEVAKGVAQASISTGVPITFGVITTETLEQAVERAGTKMGNKGWEAAQAAVEMARLYQGLDGEH